MKNEVENLIQAVRIYSEYIWMEFGIEKCAMLIMKSEKWHIAEWIEELNQDIIRNFGGKETNKYLVILEADIIKPVEM